MKKNHFLTQREVRPGVWPHIFCLLLFLVGAASCTEGYDDDYTFSPGVEGVTLESPGPESVVFTLTNDSTVTITWGVVMGSGGYEFTFYDMDDPQNPVLVGAKEETIDGCTAVRTTKASTCKVLIRTLGNEKYNNKEASSPTEVTYEKSAN